MTPSRSRTTRTPSPGPGPRSSGGRGGRRSPRDGSVVASRLPCRTATTRVADARGPSTAPEHVDVGPDPLDPGRPDEHRVQRPPIPVKLDVGLERVDLPAERVPPDGDRPARRRSADRPSRRAPRSASRIIPAQEPYAGSPPRSAGDQRIAYLEDPGQLVDRGRLAARAGRCRRVRRARSAGVRSRARAPQAVSAERCSRTSPCRARTPTSGPMPTRASRSTQTAGSRTPRSASRCGWRSRRR